MFPLSRRSRICRVETLENRKVFAVWGFDLTLPETSPQDEVVVSEEAKATAGDRQTANETGTSAHLPPQASSGSGASPIHAGPFSVVGQGTVSAGAGAKAQTSAGYEDGKLKLGGSVGAALGLGTGSTTSLEVDVAIRRVADEIEAAGRQIGQMVVDSLDGIIIR